MSSTNPNSLKLLVADERFFVQLHEIAAQPSSGKEFLNQFLQKLASNLTSFKLLSAACVLDLQWTPRGKQFNLSGQVNMQDAGLEGAIENESLKSASDKAVDNKKTQVSKTSDTDLALVEINNQRIKSVCHIPLLTGDEVTGLLWLFPVDPKELSKRELRFLSQVSKILAQGISQRKNLDKWIRAYRDLEVNHISMTCKLEKMCRDLTTPMTAISGISEQIFKKNIVLIKDQSLLLKNSAAHMKTLIRAVIQHIEYGPKGMQAESRLFSFNDTFTSFLREIRTAVAEKGLSFGFQVDRNIPTSMKGDVEKVQQVLKVLLDNALKFTQSGEINLSISIEQESSRDLQLRFDVRDTGMGMREEVYARLLKPVTDAGLSVSGELPAGKGGLVLVQKIVQLLNGDIEVSSRVGVGSHFSFTAEFVKDTKSDRGNSVESTLTMEAINVLPQNLIQETSKVMEEHHDLIASQLKQLYKVVCEFDMESSNEIEKLVPVLKNTVYRDDLKAIRAAIKGYDYSTAARLIKDFSSTVKVEL